ncbi:hypothetical protein, partial [Xanthomonas citri]|uniref:hypothetical protein n=1 Tax=Xanthomonas citri TaxID=346 RepID=UPI001FED76DA
APPAVDGPSRQWLTIVVTACAAAALRVLQHDRHAYGETAGNSRLALQATRTSGSDNDTA